MMNFLGCHRYMGILKSFVNNRKYPEGNIISRYGTEEVVEWSMTYLDPDNPIGVPHSRHEGRLDGVGTLGKKSINQEWKNVRSSLFSCPRTHGGGGAICTQAQTAYCAAKS